MTLWLEGPTKVVNLNRGKKHQGSAAARIIHIIIVKGLVELVTSVVIIQRAPIQRPFCILLGGHGAIMCYISGNPLAEILFIKLYSRTWATS